MRRVLPAIVAFVMLAGLAGAAHAERLVAFAAASLKTALDSAVAAYRADGGGDVAISYGGSLALARQILAGAPADVFVSADEASMDEAAKGGAIRNETRFDWLGNRLVVVAPKNAPIVELALTPEALTKALAGGRLATGEVETVPVGRYAKASLTKLGLWDVAAPHLAMTDNVRAALGFVARGEAPLGVVYATDAAAEPAVKVVAALPDDSHPPIRYPLAIVAASHNGEAARFVEFLKSAKARALFAGQGFTLAP